MEAQLPPPNIIGLDDICCGSSSWVVTLSNYIISGSIILAVIVIVLSGVKWMTANDPKSARQMLVSGVIGTAIILGVGLIIKTVASLVTGSFFN